MGYELRRMIRNGAPPSWTPLMRLVAMEIADDARDPRLNEEPPAGGPWSALPVDGHYVRDKWRDGLTQRCGVSARAISDALTSLARAGYEMRQSISTDKRGRPVYAAKGHALRFQVPTLLPRPVPEAAAKAVDNLASRDEPADDSSHESAAFEPQSSHQDVQRSHQGATPSPHSPLNLLSTQEDQSPQRLGAPGRARARPGQDHDLPAPDTRTRAGTAVAAQRAADALTEWMRGHPEAQVAP
jgi:hypothetical protein